MAAELANAGGYIELLKQRHFPRLQNQIVRDNFMLKKVREAVPGVERIGSNVIIASKTAYSGGMTASSTITTSITMPTPGSSKSDQMTVPLETLFGAFEVPDIVIQRMQEPAGAWVDPWKNEMMDIQESMRIMLSKAYVGSGTGELGVVTAFTNGSPDTVTLDSCYALQVGWIVDFVRSGSTIADGTDVTITAITGPTTFQCTMSGTPQAGDIVVLADSYNAVSNGLAGFMDNTNTDFQGVNRATNSWAQAQVVNNGAGDGVAVRFKPKKLKLLHNQIKRLGGVKPSAYVSHSDIISVIAHVIYPGRQFDNTKKMELFDTGLKVHGAPLWECEDITDDVIYAPHFPSMLRGQLGPIIAPHQNPEGGGFIQMALSGGSHTSAWVGYYRHYGALAATKLKTMGMLDEVLDLSDDAYGDIEGYST